MSLVIALTGASGAMGGEALDQLLDLPLDLRIRVFLWNQEKKKTKFFRNTIKKGKGRLDFFSGDLANPEDCARFVEGADYVLHCAALIPPRSDHVTSFIQVVGEKISAIDEYWGDDGSVPQWRMNLRIGTPIKT